MHLESNCDAMKGPQLAKVVGIVVAYQHASGLASRLGELIDVVSRVVVVDNTPDERVSADCVTDDGRVCVIRNRNIGGLAGAYNQALRLIESWSDAPDHVLFLDDDSDFGAVAPFLASPASRATTADFSIAAVAPIYVDPVTGMAGAPIRFGRWRWQSLSRDLSMPTEVSFLINSMSLWKLAALKGIGVYRTDLGVDHVDTDYCLRAQVLGYRLMLNPAVKFLHPIGERRQYRFFGKTFQAGGHSPARRKSIARNTVLLARQYSRRWPSFALLCLSRLAYEALGIVMAESDKVAKLGALVAGMSAGLVAKADPVQETRPRPQ